MKTGIERDLDEGLPAGRGKRSPAAEELRMPSLDTTAISPAQVRHLQRFAGNAALASLLQRAPETATAEPAKKGAATDIKPVGPPVKSQGPLPIKLTRKQRMILDSMILLGGPVGQAIQSARVIARLLGATVGLGIGGEAGAFLGALGGFGLYFTGDGDIGAYGDVGLELGFLYSASATMQFAITKGGLENFSGPWVCFNVTGGEVLVGGIMVICDIDKGFLGIGGSVGIGAGLPVDVYYSISNTWTTQPVVNAPFP
jgi:hypothetical protein